MKKGVKKEVLRKWAFIAKLCGEIGWKKGEEQANVIDSILVKHYGEDKYGRGWKTRYPSLLMRSRETPKKVISDILAKYCIACDVSEHLWGDDALICEKCKFGMEAGLCGTAGSLYDKFVQGFTDKFVY